MKKYFLLFAGILFFSIYSSQAQEINVLSYNIRYASFDSLPQNWDLRKEGVFSILKVHDFIGLQEVVPIQMEDIMKNSGDEYSVLFRTRESDSLVGEGSPIMYNKLRWEIITGGFFWLSGTPEIPGSNTWGAAYNRMLTFGFFRERISGDSILVINTHFDHISQTAREKSINLIIDRFKKYINLMPVVLTGDFNVTPNNPVYRTLMSGTSLSDSYLSVNPLESVIGATFHGWDSEPPVKRIDYIFISPFLGVAKSLVIHDKFNGNYPSDHFPLNSILIFKK